MKLIVMLDRSGVCDSKVQLGIFRDRHVLLGLDVTEYYFTHYQFASIAF